MTDRPDPAPDPRAADRLERLLAAGLEIFAEHRLEVILQRVADWACDLLGARYAALGVLSDDGGSLSQFVTSGLSAAEREAIGALPTGQGLLGLLIRTPRPIRTADIGSHPLSYGFPPNHPPMRSFLGVPILAHQRVFGNLYVTEKIGAVEFGDEDERIAIFLAHKAGVAIENARLLDQLQTFQASRDRFYAMMNHELRNALTGVYGWLDLLMRDGTKTPLPAVAQAFAAAEESVQLLNDLLDLSRLDAGRFEVKVQHTTAEVVLGEALRTVGPLADAAGVRLDAGMRDGDTPVRTDPKRLRQILVNLLRNGIQYSPAGTAVRVALGTTATALSFSISDQGPGIDPAVQEHLFDAYSGSQERAGTGLGLTLSRRLARLLGGDIRVESRPGQGATFTVEVARFMDVERH
jgi:signal transduction histidine kinase